MTDYERNADVSKTLTDKWKKGELKLGEHYYYTTIFSPTVHIQNFTRDVISFQDFKETVAEVLEPVPSYERLQQLKEYERIVTSYYMKPIDYETACETVNKLLDDNKRLKQENTKLKELLKLNNVLDKGLKSILVWLKEETQGEQKELCEQLYKDTLEMMSKIDQVLGEE